MHANEMEDIEEVSAGDIFAIFGVECATGETLTEGDTGSQLRCSTMHVPDPVMSLTIKPNKNDSAAKFQKALSKFQREDPTFRMGVDKESEEIIISGMG
jgi:elongation factor G